MLIEYQNCVLLKALVSLGNSYIPNVKIEKNNANTP